MSSGRQASRSTAAAATRAATARIASITGWPGGHADVTAWYVTKAVTMGAPIVIHLSHDGNVQRWNKRANDVTTPKTSDSTSPGKSGLLPARARKRGGELEGTES